MNNAQELSHSQMGLLRAPLRDGGLGLLSFESASDAAYAAACIESASHVRSVIPEDLELHIPGLSGAAEHLRDAWGVDLCGRPGTNYGMVSSFEGDRFHRC